MAITTFYGLKIPAEQFPLTHKHRQRIARIAVHMRQAPEDTLQDAIICELVMRADIPEKKRDAYFLTSVYNNTRRRTWRQYKHQITIDVQDPANERIIRYDPVQRYNKIYISTLIEMIASVNAACADIIRHKINNPDRTWIWIFRNEGYCRRMRKTAFYQIVRTAKEICASAIVPSTCKNIEGVGGLHVFRK